MIWQALELQFLDYCGASITFAVNWFLQSTLLIGTGLMAAWLFRTRGSAFQSVVYRTTLSAVVLAPFVSFTMAFSGLEGLSLKLPQVFAFNRINEDDVDQRALQNDANQRAEKFVVGPKLREVAPAFVRSSFAQPDTSSQEFKESKAEN